MKRLATGRLILVLASAALWLGSTVAMADEQARADARRLLMTGKYAEAEEAYGRLRDLHPAQSAIGLARCQSAQGEYDKATATLTAATLAQPDVADLHAEIALLAFERGQYPQALEAAETAIRFAADTPAAHWVRAELYRTAGDLASADKTYNRLVGLYNEQDDFTSADDLRYIGLAAAQYARWNRLTDQFTFLVNELFPDSLEVEAEFWPAHYEAGLLYLEKFNQAEASRELRAAQKINPHSADVHAALARLAIQNYDLDAAQKSIVRALEIHPMHLGARLMLSDVHLANFAPDKAVEVLEEARQLNPAAEALLGRLAAAYGMQDGLHSLVATSRMGRIIAEVTERNPHAGHFYHALAAGLDRGRRFPESARYYAEAVRVMPRRVGPRGQLGLMHMRLGNEAEARRVLEESFDIDPFNVRVSNTLKVLDLPRYLQNPRNRTLHDSLRRQKRPRSIEGCRPPISNKVYPELCTTLGFEPPEKSLFEIFNSAKNTDGHGWFSARMVGLPNVHTIGACAGKMVAITSPTSMRRPVNWARVLKHEMVHVINLQQTQLQHPPLVHRGAGRVDRRQPSLDGVERHALPPRATWASLRSGIRSTWVSFVRTLAKTGRWPTARLRSTPSTWSPGYGEESLIKMLSAYRDNLNDGRSHRAVRWG